MSTPTTSQNGWPLLPAGSKRLHEWVIPARTGPITLRLRNGSAGFLLVHFLLWWAEVVEPLAGKIRDDWGHAVRLIRDGDEPSNHQSGTAADANATRWPLGTNHMPRRFKLLIRARLALYRRCLRWGGDYRGRLDQMHTEINRDLPTCERVARLLIKTPRGRRILKANPGQRDVILS